MLISLGEHLHWLYTLGEWWAKNRTDYFEVRDAHHDGRTAGALAWARNFFTHDLIEPGEPSHSYPGEDVYPSEDLFPGYFWRWRRMSGHHDKAGRHVMYVERVVDRGLLIPIDAAARFLTNEDGTLSR